MPPFCRGCRAVTFGPSKFCSSVLNLDASPDCTPCSSACINCRALSGCRCARATAAARVGCNWGARWPAKSCRCSTMSSLPGNAMKSLNWHPIMPALVHKRPDGTEKRIEIGSKPAIIGRLPESEIQVREAFISRVHAGIGHAGGSFTLKDLGSTNGTYRNGARVFECNLANGDKVQV